MYFSIWIIPIWDFEKNSQEALIEIFSLHQSVVGGVNYEEFYPKYKRINEQYWDRYRKNQVTKEVLRIGRFREAFHHFGYDFSDAFSRSVLPKIIWQEALLKLIYLREHLSFWIIWLINTSFTLLPMASRTFNTSNYESQNWKNTLKS